MIYQHIPTEEEQALEHMARKLEVVFELLEEQRRRWLIACYGVGVLSFLSGFYFCVLVMVK